MLAGVEMALWDALGKAVGQPVYRLLGGAVREEVDYFGFVQGDTTDELAAHAAQLAAAGYGVIYLKVGRGDAGRPARTRRRCARPSAAAACASTPTAPGASARPSA